MTDLAVVLPSTLSAPTRNLTFVSRSLIMSRCASPLNPSATEYLKEPFENISTRGRGAYLILKFIIG